MNDKTPLLYAAPLQGYTEAEWRHYHAAVAGGADAYYTPFLRIDKGAVRSKDMRDITSALNNGIRIIPQILIRDTEELRTLVDADASAGYREININMGCPFAPIIRHGRGTALLADREMLHALGCEMKERYSDVRFSAKMRLGLSDPAQWRTVIHEINEMPLTHLTVHPRTAAQQYSGELHMEEFAALLRQSSHPVVYNGDLSTPADIDRIIRTYPAINGIMAGRGLLARPTLFAEWRTACEQPTDSRLAVIIRLHDAIYSSYRQRLCGDSQILSKIKPMWEYLEGTIGHKAAKAIRKATSLAKYEAAVATIR